MEFLTHETQYRSVMVMQRLREARVVICGCGALGANIAENLARQGVGHLVVIDRDRVEHGNLCTQPFMRGDVGAPKARVVASVLMRAIGADVTGHCIELTDVNARKLLKGAHVVVDAFDNTGSRKLVQSACADARIPCLHAGLSADYAEAIWDPRYRVPDDTGLDLCNYPLARNLVMLTCAVASELLIGHLSTGTQEDRTITLRDFAVRPLGR